MSLKFSLVYITCRPGGYDMLADGLKNQTYKNFELIVVDDMVSRQKQVKEFLEGQGLPVAYVGPSKKPCFPELGYNVVNSWNTGVLKSTGDVVIHINDYQWYYPNSLEKFLRWEEKFKEKTCIVCGGDMYEDNRSKNLNGLLSIWDPPWTGDALANGCTFKFSWMPEEFETTFSAFPYDLFVDMNGYLESCDAYAAKGQFDAIIERLKSVGGKIIVDPDNKMQMINHRDWQPADTWHQSKRAPQGSTTYVPRENCFNLREHVRGDLSKYQRENRPFADEISDELSKDDVIPIPPPVIVPIPSPMPVPTQTPPQTPTQTPTQTETPPETPKKVEVVAERVWIYERRPYTAKADADAILQEFDDVANMLNIPHFLFHGTCIGLYLDKMYCATDPDIDVGVICSTEQRDVLFQHLFDRGYIQNDMGQDLNLGNCTFIKNNLRLDVYYGNLPMDFLKTFDTLEYNGRRYNLPSPIEDYLVKQYGTDWRTQKFPGLIIPEELVKDNDIYEVGEGIYYMGAEGGKSIFHKVPSLFILIINKQKLVKMTPFGTEDMRKVLFK